MTTITVCSYFGTGSSAVTDYIGEFNSVKSLTDYEFRFAHDPDGLRELEFNLVENFNRHNSGHALKRYKRFVDYYSKHFMAPRYEAFFHGEWNRLSYKYIETLTDFSYPGIWQFDYYDKGAWWEFWHKLPNRILHKLHIGDSESEKGVLHREVTYASHPTEEDFLNATRLYTDALMRVANIEQKPFLMVDQLLPSTCIAKHMRYFSHLKAFVVDRDPRDVYLLSKYRWNTAIVPLDLDLFCKWFEYSRSTRKEEQWNPDTICFVQFEDLIYKYDETTKMIREFIGLTSDSHDAPRSRFDPNKSIRNTRLWEQNIEWKNEADYIARKLPNYLYHLDGEL